MSKNIIIIGGSKDVRGGPGKIYGVTELAGASIEHGDHKVR